MSQKGNYLWRGLTFEDRFWQSVDKSAGPNGCWIWRKASLKVPLDRRYGRMCVRGKGMLVHRIAWLIKYGSIPHNKQVLHHCDNPPCVNVRHLFLGTPLANAADKIRKGRVRKFPGELSHKAKLTTKQVLDILAMRRMGHFLSVIAKKHGVSRSNIFCIVNGSTWKDVKKCYEESIG